MNIKPEDISHHIHPDVECQFLRIEPEDSDVPILEKGEHYLEAGIYKLPDKYVFYFPQGRYRIFFNIVMTKIEDFS